MKIRVLLPAVLGCLAVTAPAMAIPSRAMFASTFLKAGDVQLVLNGGAEVLNAEDAGWYSELGNHSASNKNYIAGLCGAAPDPCRGDDLIRNDYFAFNLGSESLSVTSAVLKLWNPSLGSGSGYTSTNPSELYKLYDVSTNVVDLMNNNTGDTGLFDDLGTGTLFGSRIVTAADNGNFVEITLNADAIAALNNASKQWAIGGTLDLGQPVPEPTTLLLLGPGLVVGGRLRRRR